MGNALTWTLTALPLELAYTWRISRGAVNHKTNFVVRVTDGQSEGCGEVAPNLRYSETPEIIAQQYAKISGGLPAEAISITELFTWLQQQGLPNALDFGIRSAYQHFLTAKTNLGIAELLGIEAGPNIPTSFSVPIMPVEHLQVFFEDQQVQRFKWLKLKVNPETLTDTVREAARLTHMPLLLDGNEAWTNPDELATQLNQLQNCRVQLVEQPMPAHLAAEYQYLKPRSPFPLLADESVTDQADMSELKKQFHGLNMKLMKARCYYNGAHLLRQARQHGLFTMVGCMVETSLGISSAMNLASLADYTDLDGFLLVKNDPFKLVHEQNGLLNLA